MKKNVKEQIDYGNYPERMDPSVERRLGDPEKNVYGTNPAMAHGSQDVERLGSSRFKKVVDKLREATGFQNLTSEYLMQRFMIETLQSVRTVKSIENRFAEQLEALAVKAGLKATEVEEGRYIIDAKLTSGPGEIDAENFKFEPEELEEPEAEEGYQEQPEFDINQLTKSEQFELEKHKRNIINGIIQGASKRGHYIFQDPEIKAELDQIDDRLYTFYLKIMAINDYFYFSMEEMIEQASKTGQGIEGKEEIESDEEGDVTIHCRGLLFPILCHEVIKGIEEALALHGLPKDPDESERVRSQTDTLPNESITLKIGPELIDRIRQFLPDAMFSEENFGIKPFFYKILYEVPAKPFLNIMRNVISQEERDNNKAIEKFREIFEQARAMRSRYEQSKNKGEEPSEDDDIEKFLNDLKAHGIGRSEDVPDIEEPKRIPNMEKSEEELSDKKLSEMGINALNFQLNNAIDAENWELAQRIQRMIERKQGE